MEKALICAFIVLSAATGCASQPKLVPGVPSGGEWNLVAADDAKAVYVGSTNGGVIAVSLVPLGDGTLGDAMLVEPACFLSSYRTVRYRRTFPADGAIEYAFSYDEEGVVGILRGEEIGAIRRSAVVSCGRWRKADAAAAEADFRVITGVSVDY